MENQNPYQFPSQGQSNQNIPPSPPSPEGQIGIRSMQSDLESIHQSGGEAPQSQIISAPELASTNQSFVNPNPSPSIEPNTSGSVSGNLPQENIQAPIEPPKKTGGAKTVLILIGGLILAGAIGFGAYYLISSLNSTPEVVLPGTESNLPINTTPENTPEVSQEVITPTESVIPPLIHKSVIESPAKIETLTLTDLSLGSFEGVISTASKEKFLLGSVKDLSFVDASGTLVESSAFLTAYLPQVAPSLTPLFERDFTLWMYYDKLGGAKLGALFELVLGTSVSQVSSTVQSSIEVSSQDISKFFVSNQPAPTKIEFKDGQVEGVPVRFIVFNSKVSDVFEYGWLTFNNRNYLVLTSSYNQMVDIIKRLKASSAVSPSVSPTQTTSATTTNP
ncbi:MAG TPA: hypothetical protein PK367_00100 [Candidatus Paceibacterota bacterium]|nr:hypothetical protein [Candidatus Paceibacterota bacterium]